MTPTWQIFKNFKHMPFKPNCDNQILNLAIKDTIKKCCFQNSFLKHDHTCILDQLIITHYMVSQEQNWYTWVTDYTIYYKIYNC